MQISAKEGLNRFGERAANVLKAEWIQLDRLDVVQGVYYLTLTKLQRQQALRLVQLIKLKRCGKVKGRICADGRKQRAYIPKEDAKFPTVSDEGLILSFVTDGHERHRVMTADVSGAFLHSNVVGDVFVVVDGVLAGMLIRSNRKYEEFVHITQDGRRVVYLKLKKGLCGTLAVARLLWGNIIEKLINYGFTLNEYDQSVANKIINGMQCTVAWHVDDLKVSHKEQKVIDDVLEYLADFYGKLSITTGNKHTYVGMDVEFP